MQKSTPITRSPLLVQQVVATLQEQILSNGLMPETRLREEQIAGSFNVSRTPIREALIKLEHLGFVNRRSNGGWLVATIDVNMTIERYELNAMIEAFAVQRSTEESRNRLLERIDGTVLPAMRKAVEDTDIETYRDLDYEMHHGFLSLHHNSYVEHVYLDNLQHIRWMRTVSISMSLTVQESFRDHCLIIDALRTGDILLASLHLNHHASRVINQVRSELKQRGRKLTAG